MDKKLSIITINLNNREGLERTIQSVLKQDSRDFEFIVVDGASTDGSVDLLQKYREQITHLIIEKDTGIYDAMNKGIAKADGTYLQFLNSGDVLFATDTISRVLHVMGDEDILYGNMKILDRGTLTDGFMPEVITTEQMVRDTLWHPVSFIRKSLFTKLGFYDTSFRIAGDYDFFFRAIVVNRCTTRHINRFIVVFELSGLSSDIKNVSLIAAEKDRVQKAWLTPAEIESYKTMKPAKMNIFDRIRQWFQ